MFIIPRVQEAAADVGTRPNKWEQSNDSEEEPESEETKKHKEEFRQWRKKHYNEFHAVQRARELIAKVHIIYKYSVLKIIYLKTEACNENLLFEQKLWAFQVSIVGS